MKKIKLTKEQKHRQAVEAAAPYKGLDLSKYPIIILNSSAGKDSQAQIDYAVAEIKRQGLPLSRLIVVHADLGRVEWKGTAELAERQAKQYGLRFIKVSREQDLLDHIESRGMFPSSTARYCTSDHKRDQIAKVITALCKELYLEWRKSINPVRPHFKVLNCMGIRAEESRARAKKAPLKRNARLSTKSRTVIDWYPIFDWTEQDVWARIKESGVEYHKAYDLGMPRLSCVFCVFAPKHALKLAAQHNPELFNEYCRVEAKIGHTFRKDFSIVELKENRELTEDVTEWNS